MSALGTMSRIYNLSRAYVRWNIDPSIQCTPRVTNIWHVSLRVYFVTKLLNKFESWLTHEDFSHGFCLKPSSSTSLFFFAWRLFYYDSSSFFILIFYSFLLIIFLLKLLFYNISAIIFFHAFFSIIFLLSTFWIFYNLKFFFLSW